MNKKINKHSLLALMLAFLVASCSDRFGDDLRGLGSRVEVLEKSALEAGKQIEALWTLVRTIQSNGYITDVTENTDGSYTVTMVYYTDPDDLNSKTSKTYTIYPGTDGKEANLIVSVKQDPYDGLWYWTLNGEWLRDANGNRVRAGAKDGKDGKDGQLPKFRINSDGIWEYSTDEGNTWSSTGQPANGKDGRPDFFKSVVLSEDGTYLIITPADGRPPFEIPIKQDKNQT